VEGEFFGINSNIGAGYYRIKTKKPITKFIHYQLIIF